MISVLVCDDDKIIAETIQNLLDKIKQEYRIDFSVDIADNAGSVLGSRVSYDIAIVDVVMPGMDGIKLTEMLQKKNPDIIVLIITSFSGYLDSAMDMQVFRYLSKPIDEQRFIKNFLHAIRSYKQLSKQIIVEKSDEVHTIKTKDILYIENLKHGSTIVTKKDSYKTNKKPQEWYEIINQKNCFVFSHKSYIVNLQNIISFDKSGVVFSGIDDNIRIACVSQRRYSDFKKAFYNFAADI